MFLDRRKWQFINGTPEERRELHASVFYPVEQRRRDLLINKRLAYQKRQKLIEKQMMEEEKEQKKKIKEKSRKSTMTDTVKGSSSVTI